MSEQEFQNAAENVKKLSKKPSDDTLLQLYGLYKQATAGDNDTSKPGMMDIKGKAKWDAWNKNKGKSQESARQEYINLANSLK